MRSGSSGATMRWYGRRCWPSWRPSRPSTGTAGYLASTRPTRSWAGGSHLSESYTRRGWTPASHFKYVCVCVCFKKTETDRFTQYNLVECAHRTLHYGGHKPLGPPEQNELRNAWTKFRLTPSLLMLAAGELPGSWFSFRPHSLEYLDSYQQIKKLEWQHNSCNGQLALQVGVFVSPTPIGLSLTSNDKSPHESAAATAVAAVGGGGGSYLRCVSIGTRGVVVVTAVAASHGSCACSTGSELRWGSHILMKAASGS